MVYFTLVRGHDGDPDEAVYICEHCGARDYYVFTATEPYENAERYFFGRPCRRCGKVSNETA